MLQKKWRDAVTPRNFHARDAFIIGAIRGVKTAGLNNSRIEKKKFNQEDQPVESPRLSQFSATPGLRANALHVRTCTRSHRGGRPCMPLQQHSVHVAPCASGAFCQTFSGYQCVLLALDILYNVIGTKSTAQTTQPRLARPGLCPSWGTQLTRWHGSPDTAP